MPNLARGMCLYGDICVRDRGGEEIPRKPAPQRVRRCGDVCDKRARSRELTVHLGADTHGHQSVRSGCAAVHGGVPYDELTNLRVAQRRVMITCVLQSWPACGSMR